jgi:glycerophosphoryl diester phosphodiesterase
MRLWKSMASLKFAKGITRQGRQTDWLLARPFAHRGLHRRGGLPVENSMSAFKAAVASGFGIELDVQCSADGVAMVFHDLTLERLTGRPEKLGGLTAHKLGKIKLAGSDDTIPTLHDVLKAVGPETSVLVEVKGEKLTDGRLEASVAKAIDACPGKVAVMSFWPASLIWFLTHAPHLPRGLVGTTRFDGELGLAVCRGSHQETLLDALDVDFIAYDIKCLPNRVSLAARRRGLPVLTWTVRTDADRSRATRFADNIIFERP